MGIFMGELLVYQRVFLQIMGKPPQIIHLFIGFGTMIFTIFFLGGLCFPLFFGNIRLTMLVAKKSPTGKHHGHPLSHRIHVFFTYNDPVVV